MQPAFLRINEVRQRTGLSRSSIYALSSDPESDFPKRVRLTAHTVAWRAEEVEAWVRSRPVVGQ